MLIAAEARKDCHAAGTVLFLNYLRVKYDLYSAKPAHGQASESMTFTAAVAHGIFDALWFREEYLREHALDACTELTHDQGIDVMKIRRKHFADTERNKKRRDF